MRALLAATAVVASLWALTAAAAAAPVPFAEVENLRAGPVIAGQGLAWIEWGRECPDGGALECEMLVLAMPGRRRVVHRFARGLDTWDLAASPSLFAFHRADVFGGDEPGTTREVLGIVQAYGSEKSLIRCHSSDGACPGPLESGGVDVSGRFVALGHDAGVTVYDQSGSRARRRLIRSPKGFYPCCGLFDLAGPWLAMSGYESEVLLFDWRSRQLVHRINVRPRQHPVELSLQPDGTFAYVYDANQKNRLWVSRPPRHRPRYLRRVHATPILARGRIAVQRSAEADATTQFDVLDLRGRMITTVDTGRRITDPYAPLQAFDGRCLVWSEKRGAGDAERYGVMVADVGGRGIAPCPMLRR
ncbi:MAG TPA: hypothetical protein VNT32_09045 [Thermoleophilaceae bacterium]|nr:hypothetical protein [Thermoleophilaceae bacterium]